MFSELSEAARNRLLFWAPIGGLLALALAAAFWPRAVLVDMAPAPRGAMRVTVDETGVTRIREVFVVSAPVAAQVLRIGLEPGDRVLAGRTEIARLEPVDPGFLDIRAEAENEAALDAARAAEGLAAAELSRVRAELDFARSELARARSLEARGVLPTRGLEEAEQRLLVMEAGEASATAALSMRESERRRAEARLAMTPSASEAAAACDCLTIAAPIDGVVLRVLHESAGVVAAGEPLVEIGDPRDLEIVVDLLSQDAVRVAPGMMADIERWGGERVLAARVERVEPWGFEYTSALGVEERRVNALLRFEGSADAYQSLGHGFEVEARIVVWSVEHAVRAPLTALFRDGEDWGVFEVQRGRARRRIVEIGRANGVDAEVVSGLDGGETLILNPSDDIKNDVRVAPRGG